MEKYKNTVRQSVRKVVKFLLEVLGNPGPTLTLRTLPLGLRISRSPESARKNFNCLVPPPPHPSFFILNSRLEKKDRGNGNKNTKIRAKIVSKPRER